MKIYLIRLLLIPFLALVCLGSISAVAQTTWQFDFGVGTAQPGYTRVSIYNDYSASFGFGFEQLKNATASPHAIGSDQPFFFSANVPEGNYAITLTMGSDWADSEMTVKAELRRLMLERVVAPKGEAVTRTFVVNVRTPEFAGSDRVRLKARERENEMVNWDERLTLEFNGNNPALRSLTIAPTNVPTIFLTGDSTVCDQPREPWNSWGQMLPRFFGPAIAVANHAQSGESIRSSLSSRRFSKVFSQIQTNDWVLFQYGHNDMKDRATNALVVYRSNLVHLVRETRAHGATPVLVTSMERKAGIKQDTLAGYPDTVRDVAEQERVSLIDLHASSKVLYRALGTNLDLAFQDGTHHNNFGSYELARCVVEEMQRHVPALAKYLRPDLLPFDPAHPDDPAQFQLAISPLQSDLKPDGN